MLQWRNELIGMEFQEIIMWLQVQACTVGHPLCGA
jgi:hypothetical protein